MPDTLPNVNELVAHFEVPTSAWVDNCYALAMSIEREIPEYGFTVIEGVWIGEVAETSYFRSLVDQLGVKELAHWWLELPDGRVYDPTRWLFEGAEPYVYVGDGGQYRAKNASETPQESVGPRR